MIMWSYCYVNEVLLLCLCGLIVMFMWSYCYDNEVLLLCLCDLIVMYVLFCIFRFDCVVLCVVCVYMCTVLLPPGSNPTAVKKYIKGKLDPLHAWSGLEGSRKLGFPDFMTTAQDGGKVVSLTHRPSLPPGNTPGAHFC